MSDERIAGYGEGWAAGKDAYDKLFQDTIDAHGRLVDRNAALESQNQALQERAEKAEAERRCPKCEHCRAGDCPGLRNSPTQETDPE